MKSVHSRTCITAAKVKISVCTKRVKRKPSIRNQAFYSKTIVSFEGLLQLYKGSKTFWSYVGKASGMFIHATIKPNKQGWFPISSASAYQLRESRDRTI